MCITWGRNVNDGDTIITWNETSNSRNIIPNIKVTMCGILLSSSMI